MAMQRKPIDLAEASRLWKLGAKAADIGAMYGLTENAFYNIVSRHRESFPHRSVSVIRSFAKGACAVSESGWRADRVVRTSITGALITMPRVTYIDGPAPGVIA